ncbi:hypothetical protein KC850_02015 [Candidatus Kaiserbacteria bacterium]|nr:hypothetical protein [Candidatus Kaiserbacteria bacterium]MCB9818139.1 hypothetical protein [Candidatus Nomurabacteria bacterium]
MNFISRKFLLVLFLPVLFFSTGIYKAEAGFGITPPYVRNTSLTRNSTYEQQILLVRGDANIAQKAEIIIDAPDIEGWIEVLEGEEIKMPKGTQKVPMTVRVTVPDNAQFGEYKGSIRIRTLPDDDQVAQGAVSISLGALVDIDLLVIDRQIKDFRVRKISAPDLNEGNKVGWLFFPGKINFEMLIENTGNVDIAPSKVEFRIFDRSGKVMLEESKNIGRVTKIKPYATESVIAKIPTRLPAGGYIARYKVFNGDEIKQEGDITLNILPEGSLQTAGFGFIGLSIAHKISILLPIFAVIIAALYIWRSRAQVRVRTRRK